MKLINVFLVLVLVFSGKMWSGNDKSKPEEQWVKPLREDVSRHINIDVLNKLSGFMRKEEKNQPGTTPLDLITLGKEQFFSKEKITQDETTKEIIKEKIPDQEAFEKNLKEYQEPCCKRIKDLIVLRRAVFHHPFEYNDNKELYDKYPEIFPAYFLKYTHIKNLKKDIIEKNNLPIVVTEKEELIGDNKFVIKIFEDKMQKYKTVKIPDLTLKKNETEDTFSFINGIVEKYPNTKRIIAHTIDSSYGFPEGTCDNWKYKHITLQAMRCERVNFYEGYVLLHFFVEYNDDDNKKEIKILRDARCDPNVQNSDGETALYLACQKGYVEVVKELLKFKNIDLEVGTGDGFSLIEKIIMEHTQFNSRDEIIQLLLEHGVDPNFASSELKNNPCNSLLTQACKQEDFEIVKLLVKYGVVINAKNHKNQQTAIYTAINFCKTNYHNSLKIIELLLNNGADINIQDEDGNTPLHIACTQENFEIVELLVKSGAVINAKNHEHQQTPMHIAINLYRKNQQNLLKIIELLLKNKADIDIQDKKGNTTLHIACKKKYDKIVKLLLKNGSRVGIKNNANQTPLNIVLDKNMDIAGYVTIAECRKIIKFLLEKGVDAKEIPEKVFIDIVVAIIQNAPSPNYLTKQKQVLLYNANKKYTLTTKDEETQIQRILKELKFFLKYLSRKSITAKSQKTGKTLLDVANKKGNRQLIDFLIQFQVSLLSQIPEKSKKHSASFLPDQKIIPPSWHEKYRTHMITTIITLFGGLGILGVLKYLEYKKISKH